MQTLKTRIHSFRFEVDKPGQLLAWEQFKAERRASGIKPFEIMGDHGQNARDFQKKISAISCQEITLETEYLFADQWNSAPIPGVSETGLRLMDYTLYVWPNPDIKSGYYLEQTEAMAAIRAEMVKCGHCEKMEHVSLGNKFCHKCLGSEFLEPDHLHSLRLRPINDKKARAPLTEAERAELMPLYTEAQLHGTGVRSLAHLEKVRKEIAAKRDKAIKLANMEHDGFAWLLDKGLQTENVIFYDHTATFSWGWRAAVFPGVAQEIAAQLEDFPFAWEIKCQNAATVRKPVAAE